MSYSTSQFKISEVLVWTWSALQCPHRGKCWKRGKRSEKSIWTATKHGIPHKRPWVYTACPCVRSAMPKANDQMEFSMAHKTVRPCAWKSADAFSFAPLEDASLIQNDLICSAIMDLNCFCHRGPQGSRRGKMLSITHLWPSMLFCWRQSAFLQRFTIRVYRCIAELAYFSIVSESASLYPKEAAPQEATSRLLSSMWCCEMIKDENKQKLRCQREDSEGAAFHHLIPGFPWLCRCFAV